MARTIFLVLILLNALALAWVYLKGDARLNAGREPLRAKSELAASKIRLLAPEDNPSEGLTNGPPAISAVAAEGCRAYAGATPAEAQEIVRLWSEKLTPARVSVSPVEPQPVFEVVIAGLVSSTAADAKLAELNKLGAGAGAQIRLEDDKRFSVLLATFPERAAADEALKNAAKKGVRSAMIVPRQAAPTQSTIEVRGADISLKALDGLASSHKNLTPAECAPQ